ncbi:LCR40 [Arabidopsis thaliana]|uniref:LCR40 n=2 Tax=Arabidopsis TaxID=3701 RepID=A0A178VYZ2_ARATH|nr:LCR40 [Arabidopsis thaliana]
MMKNSSILLVLVFFFFISSSGEAKTCSDGWTCVGEDKCKVNCMAKHKGVGTCTLYIIPSFPAPITSYICDCMFDC